MPEASPAPDAPQFSAMFSADLASVLFDTPANPDREVEEVALVEKFRSWILTANRKSIWAMSVYIDATLVPLLSGKNLLHVAQLLEDRAPTVIDNMKKLRGMRDHLQHTAELAAVLSPASLDRLIEAIKAAKADQGVIVEKA